MRRPSLARLTPTPRSTSHREKKNLLLKLRDEGMVRHVLEGMLDIVEEVAVATVDLTED